MNTNIKLELPNTIQSDIIARTALKTFLCQENIFSEDISDAEMALSEAVKNCIYHAYPKKAGRINVTFDLKEEREKTLLTVIVCDCGIGIKKIEQARSPLLSTNNSFPGMGFIIIESFMDDVSIRSTPGKGTTITMKKRLHKV